MFVQRERVEGVLVVEPQMRVQEPVSMDLRRRADAFVRDLPHHRRRRRRPKGAGRKIGENLAASTLREDGKGAAGIAGGPFFIDISIC
jgi:hypothetical protein